MQMAGEPPNTASAYAEPSFDSVIPAASSLVLPNSQFKIIRRNCAANAVPVQDGAWAWRGSVPATTQKVRLVGERA